MVNIYEYFNYRKLLKDLYEKRKAESSSFSYRFIGSRVGFSSAGFFTKILQGKANISPKNTLAFARLFKLNKHQTRYFELLVQFNQAKTDEDKKYFFEQLLTMKQTKVKVLDPYHYELFSNWYYVVIREVLDFYLFEGDYKSLAMQVVPAIKPAQAKMAIETLEKLKLIVKHPNGYYERTDAVISAGGELRAVAVRNFQKESSELAMQAVEKVPREFRDISTLTLSISQPVLETIREKAKQFRRELLELARGDANADRVYHMNLHLFPVSRYTEEDRS